MLSNVAEAEKVSEAFKASNCLGKVHSVQKKSHCLCGEFPENTQSLLSHAPISQMDR